MNETSGNELQQGLRTTLRDVEAVLAMRQQERSNISEQFAHALQSLVLVRDRLTGAERSGAPFRPSAQLDHINAMLSVMTSIEYPLAGIHWPRIEQVRDGLRQMTG